MKENKISALVITLNSEKTLERTLKSLKPFDEIVIVDGGSTDRTLEIAQNFDAKVFENPFSGFTQQRNFAIDKASYSWCLFVDSDEEVEADLAQELYRVISTDSPKPLYRVYRTEYILGKEIKTGHGKTGPQERFFNKSRVKYSGEIHEYPVIDGNKPTKGSELVGNLDSKFRINHNPNTSMDSFISKVGPYSILKAKEKMQVKQVSTIDLIFIFPLTLLKVWLKSFKEGKRGLLAAILEAVHRLFVYLLIYEKKQIIEKENGIKS